jgi:hypothetical protein
MIVWIASVIKLEVVFTRVHREKLRFTENLSFLSLTDPLIALLVKWCISTFR